MQDQARGQAEGEGLKRLFEHDGPSGANPEHAGKLRNILATLHAAPTIAHMDMPGFRLHPLKGGTKGFWALTVSANWRVIFRFDKGAEDVDYVDYHLKGFNYTAPDGADFIINDGWVTTHETR